MTTRRAFIAGAAAVVAVPVSNTWDKIESTYFLDIPTDVIPIQTINGLPVYFADRLAKVGDLVQGAVYDIMPRIEEDKLIGFNVEPANNDNFGKLGQRSRWSKTVSLRS